MGHLPLSSKRSYRLNRVYLLICPQLNRTFTLQRSDLGFVFQGNASLGDLYSEG
jgi:hypothetical protein